MNMKHVTFTKQQLQIIWIVCITMVIGLIAHAYCYFSTPFLHDALMLHQGDDNVWKVALGRFVYPFYMMVRGDIVIPWLIGLLSLTYISVANCLLIQLLKIEGLLRQALVCGIFAVNIPIILLNASYIHDVDANMLALLLSVGAVYLLERYKWGTVYGAIAVALSLGIYQSFLQVTATLLCLLFLQKLWEQVSYKELFAFVKKALFMIVLAVILFYGINYCMLQIYGISSNTGGNGIGSAFLFGGNTIFTYIKSMFISLVKSFLYPVALNPFVVGICNGVIMICIIIGLVKMAIQKQMNLARVLLGVGTVCILPFAMAFVCIVAVGHFHNLMETSFSLVYVLLIMLYPKKSPKRSVCLTILSMGLLVMILWNQIILANQMYVMAQLKYDTTLSTMTRVIDRIEEQEGYVMNETPVLFVGSLNATDSEFYQMRDGFEHLYRGTGQYYYMGTTTRRMYEWYFEYLLAYPILCVNDGEGDVETQVMYMQKEEVQNMPNFPEVGSVQMIDGVLVVKFSSEDTLGAVSI